MLKNRIQFILKYYLFWLFVFFLSRLFFITYNINLAKDIPLDQLAISFISGLKLDLSMGGYVVFFAGVILLFTFYLPDKILKYVFKVYNWVFIILFGIISIVDSELYRNWGFRMDSTVLLYLKTPKDAMASTDLWLSVMIIVFITLFIILVNKIYNKYVSNTLISEKAPKRSWLTVPVFLFICALVFIPIRGGLGIAPINTGAVYFSKYNFVNHAAINVNWHLGNSMLYADGSKPLGLIDKERAEQVFSELNNQNWQDERYTKTEDPNIIFLILESFSSRIIEPLGGKKDVTPSINKLVNEGILYTNCFANGDRSDKGLVCILNGYPAQPQTSIIKNSAKTEKLPYLTHELNNLGYHTAFYYGGDINFANMRSYLVTSNFSDIISLKDFDPKFRNSKWGIHDHIVFDKLLMDCNNENKPFFKAFFTLSSHEPFDVPLQGPFSGETEEGRYLNSAYYTDSCLGNFITKAKTQKWWNNTIVVIVPDHGGRWPGNVNYLSREKFEIPLLLLGGALNVTDTTINTYVNQSDIVNIISRQLNKEFNNFRFSKKRLDSLQSYAFYAFNNGFGFFNPEGGFIYDLTSDKEIFKQPKTSNGVLEQGKAYVETLINDYNSK